jgi:hypothetical protein
MNIDIAVRSALYLLGLWIAVYYLWADYRNDAFRDHVFSIRDRLFQFAATGNIGFDHSAYTILRNRMNVLLRHGPEFTLTRFVLILATHPTLPSDDLVTWQNAVATLPFGIQEKMREFNVCVASALFQHVIYCSFFRYLLIRPLAIWSKPKQVREVVTIPKVAEGVARLESETIEKEVRVLEHAAPV